MKKKQVTKKNRKKQEVRPLFGHKTKGLSTEEKRRLFDLKKILSGKSKEQTVPNTAQKTITFERMHRDGICHVKGKYYTKMLEFGDINYNILAEEDQRNILEIYSNMLNYFDPSIKIQICLFNRKVNEETLMEQFNITATGDAYDDCR